LRKTLKQSRSGIHMKLTRKLASIRTQQLNKETSHEARGGPVKQRWILTISSDHDCGIDPSHNVCDPNKVEPVDQALLPSEPLGIE